MLITLVNSSEVNSSDNGHYQLIHNMFYVITMIITFDAKLN